VLLLIVVLGGLGFRFFVLGSFIDPDDVIGMTQAQVRQQYGEPDWIVPSQKEEADRADWVYYHGLRSSSVAFKDGVAIEVYHRTR